MDEKRRESIRAYLEQTDPMLGDYNRARVEHDINIAWDLLLEVERLRDGIRALIDRPLGGPEPEDWGHSLGELIGDAPAQGDD